MLHALGKFQHVSQAYICRMHLAGTAVNSKLRSDVVHNVVCGLML